MKHFLLFLFLLGSCYSAIAQKNYTLEDVYKKGIFRPLSIGQFESTADGMSYTESQRAEGSYFIVRQSFDGESGPDTLFSSSDVDVSDIDHHAISESEKLIMLYSNPQKIYRHSSKYQIQVYDTESRTLIPTPAGQVLHPSLSPDEQKISYIDQNNLFLFDIYSKTKKALTKDGETNKIINGNCDWVYEEEFGFTQAYKWSPNSQYIAYYKFDESEVRTFTMQYFKDLYPEDYTFKYPKAGEDNSKLSLWLHDTKTQSTKEIKIPLTDEYYVPRIFWTPDNQLLIYTLNRLQNHMQYFLYSPDEGNIKKVYDEKDSRYVEVGIDPLFVGDGHAIITSESSGYNHIYTINLKNSEVKALTKGKWEVKDVQGIDPEQKHLYYTSNQEGLLEMHAYQLDLSTLKTHRITTEKGYHDVSYSKSMDYLLDEYSNHTTPPQYILKKNDGSTVRVIIDNADFKQTYMEYNNSIPEYLQIPTPMGKVNAMMLKPTDFDATKKYPVLMYQYSGPGSQQVKDKFFSPNIWLHQILLQKGYIIVIADGRGTGGQGAEYKKQTYEQLGKYESDDQIAVAKWLQSQNYVDSARIGIWGWSYGGYMSSICIMKGADIFSTAIAVAPVTNWRLYDNIYTERYMGLPKDNADGYDLNSPTSMVDKLKGNFLIVHGMADDNVHFQNTAILVNQMIAANKKFDSEFYPNEAHGLGAGRYHLFQKILDYVTTNL